MKKELSNYKELSNSKNELKKEDLLQILGGTTPIDPGTGTGDLPPKAIDTGCGFSCESCDDGCKDGCVNGCKSSKK
jgi:hypothetical protein